MSRRVRYQVAVSLDGYIAGPNGEFDWIVGDPDIDFAALFAEFDTAVMGRKTYEVVKRDGNLDSLSGIDCVVFSRTLPPSGGPGLRIGRDDPTVLVRNLKAQAGKDIWLFGGGKLFRALLDAGLVDTVELAVIPVLLGGGVPVLPAGEPTSLVLSDLRTLPASGIVMAAYQVRGAAGPAPTIGYVREGNRSELA